MTPRDPTATPQLKYSISELTFPWLSFHDDLDAVAASTATGVGVWEQKLLDGAIVNAREQLDERGLTATLCLPAVWSIFPNPRFPVPELPADRVEGICESVRQLAALDPTCVMITPGTPAGLSELEAARFVTDALKRICSVASDVGVQIGLEPIRASSGGYISSFRDALTFLEAAGSDNLGVVLDVYHVWDEPGLEQLIRDHCAALIGVQLNDWREPPRMKSDRLLPGDGAADVVRFVATLLTAGYHGWYDLEVMSDQELPDSLWNLSVDEFTRRADARVDDVWNSAVRESAAG